MARRDGLGEDPEVSPEMFGPQRIAFVRYAIFGDFNGDAQRRKKFNRSTKSFSVHWIAEFGGDFL